VKLKLIAVLAVHILCTKFHKNLMF